MSRWPSTLLALALAGLPASALADDMGPGASIVAAPPLAASPAPFVIPSAGRMQLAVMHSWPVTEARERIGYLLAYWKQRFDINAEWRGDTAYLTGRVFGVKVRATFELSADQVVARAEDPGAFWRGRISDYVRGKLKKYLHPTYDEQ